jgi:hypothetical protein
MLTNTEVWPLGQLKVTGEDSERAPVIWPFLPDVKVPVALAGTGPNLLAALGQFPPLFKQPSAPLAVAESVIVMVSFAPSPDILKDTVSVPSGGVGPPFALQKMKCGFCASELIAMKLVRASMVMVRVIRRRIGYFLLLGCS